MEDVIIIGAGLSGLSAAYYLKKEGVNALLLEARERYGGRILTLQALGNDTPVEMGATWFAEKHTSLIHLLKELKIPFFKQYQKGTVVYDIYPDPPQLFEMTGNEDPSYRIVGGTSAITNSLATFVGKERILLNSSIKLVVDKQDHLELTNIYGRKFTCKSLILTLPPYLIRGQKINFKPEFPYSLINLMENTHTWMGDSIKLAFEYSRPFWREKGYSGTVLSPSGIVPELYDHSNFTETRFALKGFLSPTATHLAKEERRALAVKQIKNVLGTEAGKYISYNEKLWSNDENTYSDYKNPLLPHQNNGHPLFSNTFFNGKLYFAGSETSPHFGGYMEGAVFSGFTTAQKMLQRVN